jgi:hypothetical protein
MLKNLCEGKRRVARERKCTFCDSWGGFVFGTDRQRETDRQSVVSSSGLERYFVHNLWHWFAFLYLQWQFNLLIGLIVGQRNRVSDVCVC